jgi:TPR repeat protein
VPVDTARALTLLQADIASGDVKSGNEALGDLYRLATPRADPAAAIAAYRAAADAGNAGAMRKLAAMLSVRTPGVRGNPAEAEALLQQAAAADPRNGLPALGDFYIARTPLRNPAKAIDAYERAVAAGNAGAVLKLASAHLHRQLGAVSSPAKGVDLLKSAIADKVPNAAVTLANAYIWGTGVPQAPGAAVKILNAAANAGDVAATRRLVALYSAGTTKGIGRNLTRASMLLKAVEPQLTPDVKALDELVLKAASANSVAARKVVMAEYMGFEGETRATLAGRIYQVNPGAYVYIAQSLLAEHGLYKGARNGVLTTDTVRAMMRFCGTADLGAACVRGPVSGAAITAMAKAL